MVHSSRQMAAQVEVAMPSGFTYFAPTDNHVLRQLRAANQQAAEASERAAGVSSPSNTNYSDSNNGGCLVLTGFFSCFLAPQIRSEMSGQIQIALVNRIVFFFPR